MSKKPASIECDICKQKCGELTGWWPFQRVITEDGFITLDRSYVRVEYDEWGPEPVTHTGKFHICNTCMGKLTNKVLEELIREKNNLDQSVRPEAMEMTLAEISELVSKQLGKPVTVTVKESESCESERDKTEGKVDDCAESGMIEVAVGECIERDGITYRCVEDKRQRSPYCDGCELSDKFCADFECSAACREDGISVHFIKIAGGSADKVIHVAEGERLDRDAQIGEEFEIAGDVYRAVEDSSCHCRHCDLEQEDDLCGRLGACALGARSDGKSISFKRIPAQPTDEQKPTIAREIHDLYEVEPAIGDIIEDDGKKLKVVEGSGSCEDCYFFNDAIYACKHIRCFSRQRKDGKHIVLQEVEEDQ